MILRCAGLSSLVEEYKNELTPYYMNGTWKNENQDLISKCLFFNCTEN